MRNLRNIRFSRWDSAAACPGEALTSVCIDAAADDLLCTLGPSEHGRIRLVRMSERAEEASLRVQHREIAAWDAPSPRPDLPVDRVVRLHHFGDSATSCLVFCGGDIVIVRAPLEPAGARDGVHIEIMGSVDDGIAAAGWSPDEELLAIATRANTLVLMSRSFEAVAEVKMHVDDLKASKHVAVGWGNKETQFRGKGARALRDPTVPDRVDEGVVSPGDDGRVTISWRGDGAYFAVNSIEAGLRRVIRVYSRDGALDGVSEPVDHLDGALSWRPAGNIMAGIQRLDDRVDVIFFERNGLRHGQFSLRPVDGRIVKDDDTGLHWNADSSVLAVALADRIQLWTMGNYHWYLKQEILTQHSPSCLAWHAEKPLRLALATTGNVVHVEYAFVVDRGSIAPPHDHGAVAVIDGQSLKITPFRTANVPPPMAMFELEISSSIVDVAFSRANSYMAVLHQQGVCLYEWNLKEQRSLRPVSIGDFTFAEQRLGNLFPLQVAVNEDLGIHLLSYQSESMLHLWDFDRASGIFLLTTSLHAGSIFGFLVVNSVNYSGVHVVQDALGQLHSFGYTQEPHPVKFPTLLPWGEIVTIGDMSIALGLSRNGHLYADSRLLTKNCTSFLATPAHLIFTTANHLVKFVHLTEVDALEVPPDDPEKDERCRSIERGARLVTAIPTNLSLVLQMPRGNLETIYPRAMVVAGVRQLIEEKDYSRAFSNCRTHRVDMNILYDHKPHQFLDHVGLFLDQLREVTDVDLFLSSLRDEDVANTMYRDTKPSRHGRNEELSLPDAGDSSNMTGRQLSKVNTICDAVLSSLQSRKALDNGTLQNMVTAHVCKVPPALEDGLLVVARCMQEDEQLAERAVEHICFLADVNTLYDEALGLYNLDLALLIAQQAQRDPREYLPFIQHLHQLSDLRRKFTIDDHLKRHTKALAHLQAVQAHSEAQDYTVKHALYSTALSLYRYSPPQLEVLTGLYASHLESKSCFGEAGLAYESLDDYVSATRCYRAAGVSSWRECLFTAQQQSPPLSAASLTELATALADALAEAKDYAAAATIHLEHLHAPGPAIRLLCKGYLFADAMRIASLHQRRHRVRDGSDGADDPHPEPEPADLLSTTVDSGLAEALSSTTDFLADCRAQLRAQVPRIAELRRRAAADPLAFYEGEPSASSKTAAVHADDCIPDDVSVAPSTSTSASRLSTNASLFTRYTGRKPGGGGGDSDSSTTSGGNSASTTTTSRRRRREEKKRARGRRGTVYEEEYLVGSVRRLVERVDAARPETARLVAALARRGMAARARTVQGLAHDVVGLCRDAVAEVFGDHDGGGGDDDEHELARSGGPAGGGRGALQQLPPPRGADAVLHANLEGSWRRQRPPVIGDMERLSLLGA